jgi:hypothetical protein
MPEDLLTAPPEFKLYKENAIFGATFLGGPLVAGYLAAENFKQLGQPGKARTAWIIAILSTIAIFGGLFLIPGANKIPNYIIPLAYTFITRSLIRTYQGESISFWCDIPHQAGCCLNLIYLISLRSHEPDTSHE